VLVAAVSSNGCGVLLSPKVSRPAGTREFAGHVLVHNETLTLHFATPLAPVPSSTPVVLYASGDGGWFGAAVGMFRTIAGCGLPTVGFSTKALMSIEHRWSRPLTVTHVVETYEQIINAARVQLGLASDAPVVLTGWSRGASLAILVGVNASETDSHVLGVVAIGLAADEELDLEGDDDDPATEDPLSPDRFGDEGHTRSIAMYPLLSRLGSRRSVVIQASGDGYLPAIRARVLFGVDSATRRLVPVDARNHRFSGGESSFATELVKAVTWVTSSATEAR
jgi:hypothetical protein